MYSKNVRIVFVSALKNKLIENRILSVLNLMCPYKHLPVSLGSRVEWSQESRSYDGQGI